MNDVSYDARGKAVVDVFYDKKPAGYLFHGTKGWYYIGEGAGPPLTCWALRDIAAALDRRNAIHFPGIPAKIEERPSEQLRLDFSESSGVD
jgi:hypothetical protein